MEWKMKVLFTSVMIAVLGFSPMALNAQTQNVNTTSSKKSQEAEQELIGLFFAAAKTGNDEVIREFIKYDFPVNVKNASGFTPLMMAAYYGHQNVVTTLLDNGADRCIRDNKGNTALMGAIFKLEWSIAKQLRKVDCDIDAQKTGQKTTEEFAKVIGQDEKFKKMVAEYSSNK